jgi:nitroreductase
MTWPETFDEAWRERFGFEPPTPADLLGPFYMHRSVRNYSSQPVEEDLVASLIGAAQSAATSSNLQMWSVISVQDPSRREQLAELCAGYEYVRKSPWFFAWLADHHRLRHAASEVGKEAAGLSYTEFLIMAVIDAALAAERFVCAAESLGLGICYIGALRDHPDQVKDLLGLPEGVFGVFGMCLGWPAEPLTAHIKPRLNPEAIWFREQYDPNPHVEAYNGRMREFYESENMKGNVTWSMRSARRVGRHQLTGREVLKSWLASQGMGLE